MRRPPSGGLRRSPHSAHLDSDAVDVFTAIASKRDERRYADRPIPDDVVTRILDAGRLAGSAVNRQPWTFVVVTDAAPITGAQSEWANPFTASPSQVTYFDPR